MSNVKKLEKEMKKLAKRGATGINFSFAPDADLDNAEVVSGDMLKFLKAMKHAKPIDLGVKL